MGEAWARYYFEQRFVAADVRSAGVIAIDYKGDPEARKTHENHPFSRAAAFAVEVMETHGLDLSEHRSQRTTAGMLEWADAVLVMEPAHAEHLLTLSAEAESKIEGLWAYCDGDLDRVWDPQGRTLEDYETSANLIGDAVKRFVAAHLAARRRG